MEGFSGAIIRIRALHSATKALITGFLVGFTADTLAQFSEKEDINYLQSFYTGVKSAAINILAVHNIVSNSGGLLVNLSDN